jgi:DNA-binding response OmpR family regulator
MDILIAEDDVVSRRVLETTLRKWGYPVEAVADGAAAWAAMQRPDAPRLVILDWMMPGMDGLEVCRRLRQSEAGRAAYVILLTARAGAEDLVEGLEGGADDYIVKPFRPDELRARVRAGLRVAALQQSLTERVAELEEALAQVKQLQGLLPICAYCKRIRDDGNYWQQLEGYITRHSNARFSHGICPECFEGLKAEAGA